MQLIHCRSAEHIRSAVI